MRKLTALLLCLLLTVGVLGALPAAAKEAPAAATAYIMLADGSWTNQYWYDGNEYTFAPANVQVTGEGAYTVGVALPEGTVASGMSFMALGIDQGEILLPGYFYRIDAIRVDGKEIAFTKGYTSSDDQITSRVNVFNTWVSELPADARSYDKVVDDCAPIIVSADDFAAFSAVEIDFTAFATAFTQAGANLIFADGAWNYQYWNDGSESAVVAQNTVVTGEGSYEVALSFPEDAPCEGLSFLGLVVGQGEKRLPGYCYTIDSVEINGAPVDVAKCLTMVDDDGVSTRVNLYNVWVEGIPDTARCADGDVTTGTCAAIDPAVFTGVKTLKVAFTAVAPRAEAYIMFASGDWAVSYWNDGTDTDIAVGKATITGEGAYEVSLDFPTAAAGVAFTAVGVKEGEAKFPYMIYTVDEVVINGEPVAIGKSYTSSDDGIETRSNLFNTWVSELPADARCADGDLTDCTPALFDGAALGEVKSISVKFTAVQGKAPAKAAVSYISEAGYPGFLMFRDNSGLDKWDNMALGTLGDTVVLGDGVYEVYISKDTLDAGLVDVPAQGAKVFCIDITDLGAAMGEVGTVYASAEDGCQLEVKLAIFVDGERLDCNNGKLIYGDLEGNRKLRIEVCNYWGAGTWDNCPIISDKCSPAQELRVVFSLKGTGFNTEADTDLEAYLAAK